MSPEQSRATVEPDTLPSLQDPSLFVNRELSWLQFNTRVQDEATDPRHLLLERLKFLAISSTNLDEFFAVRVAGLREQQMTGIATLNPDQMTASEQLVAIRRQAYEMSQAQ